MNIAFNVILTFHWSYYCHYTWTVAEKCFYLLYIIHVTEQGVAGLHACNRCLMHVCICVCRQARCWKVYCLMKQWHNTTAAGIMTRTLKKYSQWVWYVHCYIYKNCKTDRYSFIVICALLHYLCIQLHGNMLNGSSWLKVSYWQEIWFA